MKEWEIEALVDQGLDRQAIEDDIAYKERQEKLYASEVPDISNAEYQETLSQLRASGDRDAFDEYVLYSRGQTKFFSEEDRDVLWDAFNQRIDRKSRVESIESIISDDTETTYRDLKREKDANTPKKGILRRLFDRNK